MKGRGRGQRERERERERTKREGVSEVIVRQRGSETEKGIERIDRERR